eukprot:1185913-Prorocentrum_minimum.AAC.5
MRTRCTSGDVTRQNSAPARARCRRSALKGGLLLKRCFGTYDLSSRCVHGGAGFPQTPSGVWFADVARGPVLMFADVASEMSQGPFVENNQEKGERALAMLRRRGSSPLAGSSPDAQDANSQKFFVPVA